MHTVLNKEVFTLLQQKLCQLFIQLKTVLIEIYLKSEKEVLCIKCIGGTEKYSAVKKS